MSRITKILLVFFGLLILILLYVFNPVLPVPTGVQSAALYQSGSLGQVEENLKLTDHTRTTMANGWFDGQPFRELNGKLSFPEKREQGPYPLIVYSHGFMSSVREADYLVEFLVPKGYVIAVVNSPLSSWLSPGGPTVKDVMNQPGDISLVMDSLLVRNRTQGDSMYKLIDPERIAVVGLSLGGLTSQLVAFHRDLRDSRVAAVVSIAGPTAFLTSEFFTTTTVPFLMIAGTSDAIISYEAHAAPIREKAPWSLLLSLRGGSHFGFASMAGTFLRWSRHPDRLACPILMQALENSSGLRQVMVQPDAIAGINADTVMPCTNSDYQRAMRPGKQRMLTRLAIYAFLESQFAVEKTRQVQMKTFLVSEFPREQSSVSLSM